MKNDNAIEVRNLTFRYREKTVLDGLSLSVRRGEHVGIVGESGCGKSTFLKLLAGLYTAEPGSVTVDGETLPQNIIKKISMVMQTPMLMPMSIRENITLGHEVSGERMAKILEAAQLSTWVATLENGIDTYLGDHANGLSGGQAQRIAIARAMAKEAEVILLDEPTSSLDRTTGEELMKALERLTEGRTVIHVTHQTDYLKGYDRVIRMENGRFREQLSAE